MKVGQHKVVTLAYLLKDTAGETLDSSEQSGPLVYIHGTGGLLVPVFVDILLVWPNGGGSGPRLCCIQGFQVFKKSSEINLPCQG